MKSIETEVFPGVSVIKHMSTNQSLGQEDPLENEMAIHPNILAWEIPWTEDLGRLQSIGSQRVNNDLASEHISMHRDRK